MAATNAETPLATRLLPGIVRLRHYDRRWLRGDVLAGVTVAAYLIPQVMAMAQVAGLEPVVGLYAIIGALVVYASLGSSPQLSCGPDSTSAIMTAAAIAPLAAGDPARYAGLAAGLAVVVGVLCGVAAAARLGFLTDLLSKPVLVGYLAGVAAILVSGQLGRLTGVPVEGDSFIEEVRSFATQIGLVHGPTLAISAATLIVLLVTTHHFPRAPVPLFGAGAHDVGGGRLLARGPRCSAHRRCAGRSAGPPVPGPHRQRRPRPAPARSRRRHRRLLGQRARRAGLRDAQPLPHRPEPRARSAGRSERRRRTAAGLPSELECDTDGHR